MNAAIIMPPVRTQADAASGTPWLPVLTYHMIEDVPCPIAVPPAVFARTMHRLAQAGWRTLTEPQVLDGHRSGAWPDRSFVLHFDDGFASVKREAWPVLEALGFSATVFVVSEWVGKDNGWPGQAAWAPRAPLMTWDELGALGARGATLGGHTANHPHMPTLPAHSCHEEVGRAFESIERLTGQRSRVFAFPYGEVSPSAIEAAQRHADLLYGTALGAISARSPVANLPRIDAYYLGAGGIAPHLTSAPVRAYLAARQAGRTLRRLVSR